MLPHPTQPLRNRLQRWNRRFGGRHWFPHVPLAVLLGAGGVWLLHDELGRHWPEIVNELLYGAHAVSPTVLPPILIGFGMVVMMFGLLFRSRLAWTIALLLAAAAAISMGVGGHTHAGLLMGYFILLIVLLLLAWHEFDQASLAAGSLFALTSVVMLLLYATLGSFYLGAEFHPRITDLMTAFYFAMVTMSTVGYGDITPQTNDARLFAISVIVLGVAVFATSLTAVIAPLLSRSFRRIVDRKERHMPRENHFVVIGGTPLALNTWHELTRRGHPATLLMETLPSGGAPDGADVVLGEPSDADVLRKAGADKAQAVLAMLADDSENAFVVLAVRELAGHARTVAAVNDAQHLSRVKLVQPDVLIAPQILGGELAAMLLTGEEISADFVMQHVFQQAGPHAAAPATEPAP